MNQQSDDDDLGFTSEEVERRAEPRGLIRGLVAKLPDGSEADVREMSRKGVFIAIAEPEQFRLGDIQELVVSFGDQSFSCRAEVVRKEIHPRRGVVMRILYITPAAEHVLISILDNA